MCLGQSPLHLFLTFSSTKHMLAATKIVIVSAPANDTYVGCMRVLAVTCHLHFWQNDLDYLHVTAGQCAVSKLVFYAQSTSPFI